MVQVSGDSGVCLPRSEVCCKTKDAHVCCFSHHFFWASEAFWTEEAVCFNKKSLNKRLCHLIASRIASMLLDKVLIRGGIL